MGIEVREIALPHEWDDDTEVGRVFRKRCDVVNADCDDWFGPYVAVSYREQLAGGRPRPLRERVHAVALVDGRIVGVLQVWMSLAESLDVLDTQVDALPTLDDALAADVHGALLDHAAALAAARGRTILTANARAASEGPVVAATGFGGADPAHPSIAPLVARGYRLEQVYRVSVVDLPGLVDLDERLAAASARSAGYRVLAWTGDVPSEHRGAVRGMHERMSTDAPTGELAVEPETWDEARLATFESAQREGGRTTLTVVAQHEATGELAGFSTLFVPPEGIVAKQHDTLVLREHRGHGLGMLLKLANLAALRAHPTIVHVTTGNAEENRHMLAVNEATGFRPVGHEGLWQRRDAA